jgi:hypothetical protein
MPRRYVRPALRHWGYWPGRAGALPRAVAFMWHAPRMPWVPELFTAPVLQRLLDKQGRDSVVDVPFFDGLVAGEPDALVGSFAGEPELHDPVRGRIKGTRAFREFVADMGAWLAQRNVSVGDVERVVLAARGFEEVVLHVDGAAGRVDIPFALVADHPSGPRLEELRVYHSGRQLTGRRTSRPPLLQRDPAVRLPDIVAEHRRALAAGDVDAIAATFETDGYAREPTGATHSGADGVRAFYERQFSDGGGIPLEPCALVDDGRACALEYNVVRAGLPPRAGLAVYVRGDTGRLAAVRIYDDADAPS